MSDRFADRLTAAIVAKGAPVCVGIDPSFDLLPPAVTARVNDANDTTETLDAIHDFVVGVLKVVAPIVPVVKFQSAYFERYLWEGVEAYYSLVAEAQQLGLLVIGDVKRGDIGATSDAYATAHLEPISGEDADNAATPDAITVNPFLGIETLQPFLSVAAETDKGVFVLVRTSNPGSADLQELRTQDGATVSEHLADLLAPIADRPAMLGDSGWSSLGAVVGATQPQTMASLRARLPRSIFLLPGYGTQGATADMTRAAFINGQGAIVSASRSILYAHRDGPFSNEATWEKSVEAAALAMRDDLRAALDK